MFDDEASSPTPTVEEENDSEDAEIASLDDEANKIDDGGYSYKKNSKRKLRSTNKHARKRYGKSKKRF